MNLDDLERRVASWRLVPLVDSNMRDITGELPAVIGVSDLRDLIAAARERDALKGELGMFREMVGIRANVRASAGDVGYWMKLMDRVDDAARLEAEVERLKAELTKVTRQRDIVLKRLRAELSESHLPGAVETEGMTPTADTDGHTGGWPIRTEQPYGKGGAR